MSRSSSTPADGHVAAAPSVSPFRVNGFHGELVTRFEPEHLAQEIDRLVDPGQADETIHWGRNYLYRTQMETPEGPLPVVVKQFRNQTLKARLRRRLRGSKAEVSWRSALQFQATGVATAPPVIWLESDASDGPSFFVTGYLPDMIEVRYIFRAVNEDRLDQAFPHLDYEGFLDALGAVLRRMHNAGFFHRDLSIGNVLLPDPKEPKQLSADDLHIVDLNRGRHLGRLSLVQRTRDLCRLAIFRPADQERFLRAYWGDQLDETRRRLYQTYHRGFLLKIESKKSVRGKLGGLAARFRPRHAHAHIPEAPKDASLKDRIVWDHLSDQPHQHAGGLAKALVRARDTPSHLYQVLAWASATPRIWSRYRTLQRQLHQHPVDWDGVGVCLRPHPEDPEALLEAVDDLGVDKLLLRLHPWQESHDEEEALAAELHRRGYELAFSLPQNRDLVREPQRWKESIEELAERFTPFGKQFQLGQAINRSKWGVWDYGKFLRMASTAGDILKGYPGVEIMGPGVIDFEPHATAGVLNRRSKIHFDIAAHLLYVDRRGAPENPQFIFDSIAKAQLMHAIAETSRHRIQRSWITEVNWPLWEGPHSPAGRKVSVDEASQANYLVRFYLLTLCSGAVERVYWWQIIARGYGLIAPLDAQAGGGLRRRASFSALATLARTLRGYRFEGTEETPTDCFLYRFSRVDGPKLLVGWTRQGSADIPLQDPPRRIVEIDGRESDPPGSSTVRLQEAVRYLFF